MSIVHHRAAWTAGRESVSLHPVTAVEAARLEKAKAAGRIYAAVCCTECLDGRLFATREEAQRWGERHICRGRDGGPSSRRGRWGAAQDRILRDNPTTPVAQLAELLGFSASKVERRRKELAPSSRARHCWTAAEEAVILAHPRLSSTQLGIKLGLPSHVVKRRRTRLRKRASEGAK